MEDSGHRLNPQVARSRAAAIRAARDILFAEGWDAVTHVSVAERSGVGRTTLYRHWPTVEQLVYDVLLGEIAMSHPVPSGSTRDDLVADLDGFRSQLREHARERVMATIMDRATADPEFAKVRDGLYQACSLALVKILQTARNRGELEADLDLAQAVAELAGPLVFQQFLAHKRLTRHVVERIVDAFLRAHQPLADQAHSNDGGTSAAR